MVNEALGEFMLMDCRGGVYAPGFYAPNSTEGLQPRS